MFSAISRRGFLGTLAGLAAAVKVFSPGPARGESDAPPITGLVYGRTGSGGIRPGRPSAPSRGWVTLLDGRRVVVLHETSWAIDAGRGVLLAPLAEGQWSILYAET